MATADLHRLPVFRGVLARDIDAFGILAPPVSFPEGAHLLRQGEAALGAFLLVSGHCRIELLASGRHKVIARAGPGDLVGENGLFVKGGRRCASVIAEEPVQVLLLTPELLEEPAARPAMTAVERRVLATMADRVRHGTLAFGRSAAVPPPRPADGGLLAGLRRWLGQT